MRIPSSFRFRYGRALLSVLLLLCLSPFAAAQGQKPPATPKPAAKPAPPAQQASEGQPQPAGGHATAAQEAAPSPHVIVGEVEDFVRQREQWFYSNRSLPDGTIPAALRLRALQQLEEMIQVEKKMGLIPDGLVTPPIDFLGPTSWTSIGPQGIMVEPGNPFSGNPLNAGRVTSIAVNPQNKDVVYMGAAAGGVWKSTNGGTSWTVLTDTQASISIGSLAVDPSSCNATDCSTIYVGTGEANNSGDSYYGAGVLKSSDSGANWTRQGAGVFVGPFGVDRLNGGAHIGAIAVNPNNNQIVLAGALFRSSSALSGLYRTTDGGTTWGTAPVAGMSGAIASSIVFDPSNNGVVYAALGNGGGAAANGVYRSTDHGAIWTKLVGSGANLFPTASVGRIALAVVAGGGPTSTTVYAAVANSNGSTVLGFFKTTDSGANWTQTSTTDICSGQCAYDLAIAVDPAVPTTLFAGGSSGGDGSRALFRSTDGGFTWTSARAGATISPHVDLHALVFSADGSRLYIGNDGGMWRTDNPTAALGVLDYINLNATLTITMFYPGPAAHQADENIGFGGAQDNGTEKFSGGLTWQSVTSGDGGFAAIDPRIPSVVYTSCQFVCIFRSLTDGTLGSFSSNTSGINASDRSRFIAPLVHDPSTAGRLYFGTFRIYLSTDFAGTWTPISLDLTGSASAAITAIAPFRGDPNVVYVGTGTTSSGGSTAGKVWKTTNALLGAGATWTELTNASLPPRNVTAIAVDRANSLLVYVTFSGFSNCPACPDTKGHVFRSADGGTTWQDISGSAATAIPNIPASDIIADSDTGVADTLYVATDIGVFKTTNASAGSGAVWMPLVGTDGKPLPNVVVLGLGGRGRSRILRAATSGRGAWVIQLTNVGIPAGPLLASMTPASKPAGSVSFTLSVAGANFLNGTSKVQWNGSQTGVITAFVDANHLTATIDTSLLGNSGVADVTVFDASQMPTTSDNLRFSILGVAPTITPPLSPTSATSGGPGFNLTVNGTNFNCGGSAASVVNFRGAPHNPATCSSTQMTVAIAASEIATGGNGNVTVFTPPPGGGTSNAISFPITGPPPANDNFANAISATPTPFTDSRDSSGATNEVGEPVPATSCTTLQSSTTKSIWYKFLAPSAGTINANTNGTAYDSVLQAVTGSLSSFTTVGCADNFAAGVGESVSFAATSGTTYFFMISDFNGFGGSTTFNLTFTSSGGNPVPTLTSLVPNSGTAGGPGFTLTVNGTNFIATLSVIQVFGMGRTTSFVSSTQLTTAVAASEITDGALAPITVFNPAPGGGTSNALTFTLNNPVPTVTTLVPSSATAGGAGFTLTVNGTNFVNSSTVNFAGIARATTFVNATQVTAAILASDIATAGAKSVTVTNPAPAGGTSNAVNFTANNPVPTVTNTVPASVNAGSGAFTLTVNGTNFNASSAVNFKGTAKATTFVNSTQLTAAIAAVDVATPAPADVTVTNPTPGGGTSSPAFVFMITSLPNPVPTITTLSPSPATAGSAFTLTVNGTNYIAASVVNVNGSPRTTTFVSATQLTAAIPASDVPNAAAGPLSITAFNPAPGGGTSNAVNLPLNNPAPAITTLSPSSALVNSGAFTLTVNGSGFVNAGSTVNFGGIARTTTFVNSGQLTAAILAGDIAAAGPVNVTVTNVAPGGGTSAPAVFTVNNPVPVLSSILPTTLSAGSGAFTLTANGSNFVNGSVVTFNGINRVTTFVSATQLTAAILASDIAATGSFPVTVFNPTPGGGTSAPQTFTATGPTITTLSPSSASAGGPAFTLTVNGTSFVSGATVTWKGSDRVTTFVSATQLTAAILASDLAVPAGTAAVQVRNFGGVLSNTSTFTINGPTITTLSPSSGGVGGPAFTLTVTGTNFVSGSVVSFGGTPRATTFGSSTSLTAAILASDIAAVGTPAVTVTNPGGATSNAVNFTVGAPTITPPLAPASALAGGGAFTLNVTGTNFVPGSTLTFNGIGRVTTVNSSTSLSAAILAGDVAAAGTFPVVVQNPGPVSSNSVNFTVNNPVPTTTSLSPLSVIAGGGAFTLTVNGTNFNASSVVNFGTGNPKATTMVSATQLTAAITAADVATAGTFSVTVTNPAPGGGTSNPQTFTVVGPTITTLSPSSAAAGSPAFTLTVNGTNFLNGSTVTWKGSDRVTTFVSATQLTAAIPASDLAVAAGTAAVQVRNPGGALSSSVNFTINAPSIATLSPSSAAAGSAAFTLTVTGTNFVNGSAVQWNGAPRPTTFVSGTSLTAAIPASDLAVAAGTAAVTVQNPGGATSNASTFTINGPTITTLLPLSGGVGGPAFTLTVNGTNFVNGSTVRWNGSNRTTTFVGATQVTAAIPAPDLAVATGGTVPITVVNPGGASSNATTFTINNPAPTITNLSPLNSPAGALLTLTVNGTGFVTNSAVNFGGKAEPTTFVSATKLTAAIPASDVTSGGTTAVTVTNPAPGGGTSPAAAPAFIVTDYTVSGPATAVTVTAGQPAVFTITVTAFPNAVTFTASNLPAGTAATFNPPSVTPVSGPQTSTMTLTTTARSAVPPQGPPAAPPRPMVVLWLLAGMLALLSLGLLRQGMRTRRYAIYLPLALLVLGLAGVVGCSSATNRGTPAGTTPITVTATSGTAVRTTTVTLTVN